MNLKTACLCLFLAITMACADDDTQIVSTPGTIVDASSLAGLEACGFLVRIDGDLYQPSYLNNEYEQDGLEVRLKIEYLNRLEDCSTLPNRLSVIRIEQISPAN